MTNIKLSYEIKKINFLNLTMIGKVIKQFTNVHRTRYHLLYNTAKGLKY